MKDLNACNGNFMLAEGFGEAFGLEPVAKLEQTTLFALADGDTFKLIDVDENYTIVGFYEDSEGNEITICRNENYELVSFDGDLEVLKIVEV